MIKKNLYQKEYKQLNKNEKKLWDIALKTLTDGGCLYGLSPVNTSHIGWGLGVIMNIIRADARKVPDVEHGAIFSLVLGKEGWSIQWFQPGKEAKDGPVIEEQAEQGE